MPSYAKMTEHPAPLKRVTHPSPLRDETVAIIGGCIMVVAAIAIYFGEFPRGQMLMWGLAMFVLYALQVALSVARHRRPHIASEGDTPPTLAITAIVLVSAAWGLGIVAVFLKLGFDASVAALLIGYVIVIFTVCCYPASTLATLVGSCLVLGPAALFYLLKSPLPPLPIGLLVVASMLAVLLSTDKRRHIPQTLAILQGESEQMTKLLHERNAEIEHHRATANANQAKLEEIEHTLQHTVAELGLAKGKAQAVSATLEQVSPYCPVTDLCNRRHFDQRLDAEWRRTERERLPLTVLIVGFGDFAEFVRARGRQASDTVLKRFAEMTQTLVRRPHDLAARYDDARFALLLPGCDIAHGNETAETLRALVERADISHPGKHGQERLSAHIGVATVLPRRNGNVEALRAQVTSACEEARETGGNKVVRYQPLQKFRVQHWERAHDGPLSEQSMLQKLLEWDYDTRHATLAAGETVAHAPHELETVFALLTGQLELDVDGHTKTVSGGDIVYVPRGAGAILRVLGDVPVTKITAHRGT